VLLAGQPRTVEGLLMRKVTKRGLVEAYVAIAFVAAAIGVCVYDGNGRRNMILAMFVLGFPFVLGWRGSHRRDDADGDADADGDGDNSGDMDEARRV
jgi:hypothetical protein